MHPYDKPCTFEKVGNTYKLQVQSLIDFAAGLGYDPVFDTGGDLVSFVCPKARAVGEERVSVGKMIYQHNRLPGQALRKLQDGDKVSFPELVAKDEDLLVALFAGYCRRVKKVKATFDKKHQLIEIQSHKVEFQTKRDRAQCEHLIEY